MIYQIINSPLYGKHIQHLYALIVLTSAEQNKAQLACVAAKGGFFFLRKTHCDCTLHAQRIMVIFKAFLTTSRLIISYFRCSYVIKNK